jgi:GDP-D-mannose dehydratase
VRELREVACRLDLTEEAPEIDRVTFAHRSTTRTVTAKARQVVWKPKVTLRQLVQMMVRADEETRMTLVGAPPLARRGRIPSLEGP